jgi:hypothetical protein
MQTRKNRLQTFKNRLQTFTKQRPPLKKRRNVVVAALVAFLFGVIGVGIYLRSWREAGIAFLIGLPGLAVAMAFPGGTVGVSGAVAGYAVWRVLDSNAQLTASEGARRVGERRLQEV